MSEAGHTERLEAALAGRYRIERKLGEGGMASVHLAEDIKHERKVALNSTRTLVNPPHCAKLRVECIL